MQGAEHRADAPPGGGARGPTVHVVDDERGVREALRRVFQLQGFKVRLYDCAEAFLEGHQPGGYGCIVLDLNMPGMDGAGLQAVLRERGERMPIVFLTAAATVRFAVAAVQAGAADVMEKPFDPDILVARVRECIARAYPLDERGEPRAEAAVRLATLSARESQVLRLIAEGHSNKTAARELGISARTVEVHRRNLMEKMGASSLAELVRMVSAAPDG